MRAATVWTTAAICGLAAFGSTLVWRAPKLPARPPGAFRPAGPGLVPDPIETLQERVGVTDRRLEDRYHLARRYEWLGKKRQATDTWGELARLAEIEVREGTGPRHFHMFVWAEALHGLNVPDGGAEQYQKAMDLYLRRITERGESAMIYYRLGWCARRLGDLAAVGKYFDRAEELLATQRDPADQTAHFLLAAMRSMRGYVGQAVPEVEAMVAGRTADREMLEGAEEFENLRGDPGFIAALAKIETKKPPNPAQ